MKTVKEFNTKYAQYLDIDLDGLIIEYPSVIHYIDQIFQDFIKIEGFKYSQIKTKFGLAKVYTNLDELLPFVGRILHQELEEKINFILKVEFEVENRLKSLNLNKDGSKIE
jgi:hypothetical protein